MVGLDLASAQFSCLEFLLLILLVTPQNFYSEGPRVNRMFKRAMGLILNVFHFVKALQLQETGHVLSLFGVLLR